MPHVAMLQGFRGAVVLGTTHGVSVLLHMINARPIKAEAHAGPETLQQPLMLAQHHRHLQHHLCSSISSDRSSSSGSGNSSSTQDAWCFCVQERAHAQGCVRALSCTQHCCADPGSVSSVLVAQQLSKGCCIALCCLWPSPSGDSRASSNVSGSTSTSACPSLSQKLQQEQHQVGGSSDGSSTSSSHGSSQQLSAAVSSSISGRSVGSATTAGRAEVPESAKQAQSFLPACFTVAAHKSCSCPLIQPLPDPAFGQAARSGSQFLGGAGASGLEGLVQSELVA